MNATHKQQLAPDIAPPVLLIFIPTDTKPLVQARITQLQQQLDGKVRVLKIEEAIHPKVVQSFDLKQLPAFVLLLQGMELWRQEGLPKTALLDMLPAHLLQYPC